MLDARSSIRFLSTICSKTISFDGGSDSCPKKRWQGGRQMEIFSTRWCPLPAFGETISFAIHKKSPTLSFLTSNLIPTVINTDNV